jgi:small subunit ribosomal protein S8
LICPFDRARLNALPAAVEESLFAMMTDPIADMLTRIRNGVRIERTILDMPVSKMRLGIAQVLKDEGYIWDFEQIETVPAKTLRLHMKYGPNGERLINRIDRVSKPGRRVY